MRTHSHVHSLTHPHSPSLSLFLPISSTEKHSSLSLAHRLIHNFTNAHRLSHSLQLALSHFPQNSFSHSPQHFTLCYTFIFHEKIGTFEKNPPPYFVCLELPCILSPLEPLNFSPSLLFSLHFFA